MFMQFFIAKTEHWDISHYRKPQMCKLLQNHQIGL